MSETCVYALCVCSGIAPGLRGSARRRLTASRRPRGGATCALGICARAAARRRIHLPCTCEETKPGQHRGRGTRGALPSAAGLARKADSIQQPGHALSVVLQTPGAFHANSVASRSQYPVYLPASVPHKGVATKSSQLSFCPRKCTAGLLLTTEDDFVAWSCGKCK